MITPNNLSLRQKKNKLMSANKTMLIILDGWGLGTNPASDAIYQAATPVFDGLRAKYPNATLLTHGENVGLPDGQMGNSEVGHINIGAGRIVYQELARINKAVREGELAAHTTLLNALKNAKARKASVHLLGLVSDGGVHSHINHLLALCDIAKSEQIEQCYIHAFLDGRDTDPKGGRAYLKSVVDKCAETGVEISSVIGRYYAMDRDKRWERTRRAYDLLVKGEGVEAIDILSTIDRYYEDGVTDEFMEAIKLECRDQEASLIKDGDLVIFYNFRTDRPRQLTTVLTQTDMPDHGMSTLNLEMISFTRYDETYQGIQVLFEKDSLDNTLGEVLEAAHKTQLRIAETEKYPHVTFFFSGGKEDPLPRESRIMVPSPKVPTYDLQPEMSAHEITEKLLESLQNDRPDFVCLNFANTDMVGHTGVFAAAMKAAETVDICLGQIVEKGLLLDYTMVIIADHGNSDFMINADGSPNTAHTTNPVPIIIVGQDINKSSHTVQSGILADVAPTILHIMNIPQPTEMTGRMLLKSI